jgi:hypothetical protein
MLKGEAIGAVRTLILRGSSAAYKCGDFASLTIATRAPAWRVWRPIEWSISPDGVFEMLRDLFLAMSMVFLAPSVRCQTGCPEPQSIEALLTEIRELRQDLRMAANGARRAQILIYRLYQEQAAVQHAAENLENAKVASVSCARKANTRLNKARISNRCAARLRTMPGGGNLSA